MILQTFCLCFNYSFSQKAAVDFVLFQYLAVYKNTATRIGMGITEEFWRRLKAKEQKSQMQIGSNRDAYESAYVKRAVGILSSISLIENPTAKVNCIREILTLFECRGDEEFSLLSYLIVLAQTFNIHWSAEIDYITTMIPADKFSILLKSIQMFFLTSWVQKINATQRLGESAVLVEDVEEDLKALLIFSKSLPSGSTDILLLLAVFFFLSQLDTKTATVEGSFSRSFLAHANMFQLTLKLQLTIREAQENGTIVYCSDDVSSSVFARLTTSFFGMLAQEEQK